METPHLALAGVPRQLAMLLNAARADGSATVAVACGPGLFELSFPDGRVRVQTGGDAAALLTLGWHRDDQGRLHRDWEADTVSFEIADDIVRVARHAYACEPEDLHMQLRMPEPREVTLR